MIQNGDTAWLLISAALVLLMTPGIAFFYSGLVSARNVINTINMCFICLAIVPLIWTTIGFTLAFAPGNFFIGGLAWVGLINITNQTVHLQSSIPEFAFVSFQMMFAVIAPAIISGAIVGRMKFKAYVLFVILWSLFIYIPIAHWVWGPNGFIALLGGIDFAGGTVVHISAGFAALVAAVMLGPRLTKGQIRPDSAHNVPFVILGASLLWFGWYGFNAGSALMAGGLASLAFITTTLAASASIFTWTLLCWFRGHPSSAIGKACSTVIGLVAITPGAGFVQPMSAILIGSIASIIGYFAMAYRNKLLRTVDDTLDVFICHGLCGTAGAILTGIFATKSVNPAGADGLFYGNPKLVIHQLIAAGITIVVAVLGTAIILFILKNTMSIRPSPEEESRGIDLAEHGESAYDRLI